MFVVRKTGEMAVSVGKIFTPMAEKMCGSRSALMVTVGRNFLEEFIVDPTSLLMEPKSFGKMVGMVDF